MNKTIKLIIVIFVIIYLSTLIFHQIKPMPDGTNFETQTYQIEEQDFKFLFDITHNNTHNHEIFDEIFTLIDNAEEFIVIDMFLFNNDFANNKFKKNLTDELTNKLIEKQDTKIIFITDRINTFYDSYTPQHIQKLKDNNITIIYTDTTKLRDSNYLYSALWRMSSQWFSNSQNGWLPHPLGNENKVTIRGYHDLLNFKANHRKLIVADNNDKYTSIITSANPHTASSNHSNIAIKINNSITKDILKSEKGIAKFSNNKNIPQINYTIKNQGDINVQFLTEKKIKKNLIQDIKSTNDSITIAMFYISDRDIIQELKQADKRGVNITLILDPNKDAFGREKGGIPNRQVAYELKENTNAQILWYDTKGEQFHTKLVIIEKNNKTIIHLGSSNLTRRNLDNYNLEANVKITANSQYLTQIHEYINIIKNNTLEYETYKDHSTLKYILYRFQESTGLSTY